MHSSLHLQAAFEWSQKHLLGVSSQLSPDVSSEVHAPCGLFSHGTSGMHCFAGESQMQLSCSRKMTHSPRVLCPAHRGLCALGLKAAVGANRHKATPLIRAMSPSEPAAPMHNPYPTGCGEVRAPPQTKYFSFA